MEWPLLADLPAEDVRELLSIARRRTFDKGEVVFHRDDPGRVAAPDRPRPLRGAGRVASSETASCSTCSGRDRRSGSSRSFSRASVARRRCRRSRTARRARSSATTSRAFNAPPRVKDVLLRLLAEQVRRTSDRIVEAHHVDADTRVRRRLCELAETYGSGDDEPVVPLTQEDLAAIAGTSRATVNRVLREEEKRGRRRARAGTRDPASTPRRSPAVVAGRARATNRRGARRADGRSAASPEC